MSEVFVGRARELASFDEMLAHARLGAGRFALITGETGIGQSRLAQEIADDADAKGWNTAWGRSWEGVGTPAYWPWTQLLRRLSSLTELQRAFADQDIGGLLDTSRTLNEPPDAQQARFRLFDSVSRLLHQAAEIRPLHEGYGFPVGGVAATRLPDGVISPGGIGFDINCGVRLLASEIVAPDIQPVLEPLVHEMSRAIPSGFGRSGRLALDDVEIDRVLNEGCRFLIADKGLGVPEDLKFIESNGSLASADAGAVSDRAKERGRDQLGTLGGGNHFLEVQVVDDIFDDEAADAFGLHRHQIAVLIHTGSRGLGHQVCTDYVRVMDEAMLRYGIAVPDRQLACVR